MRSVVAYESMYGNTHQIAEAIAKGLAERFDVTVGPAAKIPPGTAVDADLLVVGGPTHAHGMSKASTRLAAAETAAKDPELEAEPDATGPGLREWLNGIPKSPRTRCAAFDTRINKPVVLTGSAAKGISKRLAKLKFEALDDPESFFVEASEGPLQHGEIDRARQWGANLANQFSQARAG